MVAIVRTAWSGTSGGPGITQMALLGATGEDWNPGGAQGAVNAVRGFWDSIKLYLPNELTLTVSPIVDRYDTGTGELTGTETAATAPAAVIGTGTGNYAGGAGFKVTWETGSIRDGRRVRGATYIVPATTDAFTATGTVGPAAKTAVNNAAAAMIAAMSTASISMAVWSRPREESTTLPARVGLAYDAESGACSSKSAILRGRRD